MAMYEWSLKAFREGRGFVFSEASTTVRAHTLEEASEKALEALRPALPSEGSPQWRIDQHVITLREITWIEP